MAKKTKIAIFGGTFNPPHIAHVRAAERFSEIVNPDVFYIIPACVPPHKDYSGTVSPQERTEMCTLAFGHIPNVEISDIEIKRGGRSYTYLTLEALSSSDKELYLLCGTDMFLTLDEWVNPDIIFKLATICVIRRESDPECYKKIREKSKKFVLDFNAKIIEIPTDVIEISSSELRDRLFDSNVAREFIPEAVLSYIKNKGIYK